MIFPMPQAAPSILLLALVEITIAAAVGQVLVRRRRGALIRALARDWDMFFQTADTFGLAKQVVEHLPTPGAATVRAEDLVYRHEGQVFFCAFTVSHTRGALGTKHRGQHVAGVRQVKNEYSWIIAPPERKLLEQYEFVRQKLMKKIEPDKD
jgi:hypothetical protein